MLELMIISSISLNIYFLTLLSKNKSKFGILSLQIAIAICTVMIVSSAMARNTTYQSDHQLLLMTYHFFESFIPYFAIIAFFEFVNLKKFPQKLKIILAFITTPLAITSIYPPLHTFVLNYEISWVSYTSLSSYTYTSFYSFYILLEWITIFYCFYQFYRAENKACVLNRSMSYIFLAIASLAILFNTLASSGIIITSFNYTPILLSVALYFTYYIFNSFTFNLYNDLIIESFLNDINNIIIVVDKSNRIIFTNSLFSKIFKLNSFSISGKNLEKIKIPSFFLDFLLNQDSESIVTINNKKYKKEIQTILNKKYKSMTIYNCIDITDIEDYNHNFLIISTTDAITGLKNRSAFSTFMNEPLIIVNNKLLWTIILDLDNLKITNDIYGNEVGDTIISDFTVFLKEVFKNETDQIFRIGGDEFCVVTYSSDKHLVKEKIIRLYEKSSNFNSKNEVPIMFSVGYANYTNFATTKDEIYKFADIAMTKSKANGKHLYTYFDDKMYQDYINENMLKDDFMRGLNNDEIEPFFQGQYNLKTGEIDSCEALVRWNHKEHGILTPYKFLHIASSLRVISEIDFVVLDKSCKALAHWINKYNKVIKISVNLSLESLIRPTLVHDIIRIIDKHKIDPKLITLEILENKVINDFDSIRNIISELMSKGFSFAIDDFGSGFSNFDTIDQLEVNVIKLDKSLVDPICINHNAAKNIETLCKIIKSYNRETLIEGVETKEQFDILKNYQVDYIQGYYFTKPISCQEFEEKYVVNNVV